MSGPLTEKLGVVLLHPDKQQDEHRRATANDRFQRVKRAYEGV